MSRTLADHAAYELTKAGLVNSDDPEARSVATNTMALIRRFEKQKNTERQKDFILEALTRLLNFIPLTPITDDPEEWDKYEIERKNVDTNEVEKKVVWQSRRGTSIFSEDGGITWVDQATGKMGTSIDHVAAAKQLEDEAKARKERPATPALPNRQPVGHVNPDVPPGEAQFTAEAETDANNTETK